MENTFGTRSTKAAAAWAPALIVVAVAVVFQEARHGAFLLWDDNINLTENLRLRELSWENLRWMFTDSGYMRRYVPLAWLGWAVEAQLFGLTPLSVHVGNVVGHAVNAVLVFLVLRVLLRRWRGNLAEGVANWAALAGALVWTLHPLRVEVVAWASGRMYVQMAFFALAGLLAYLRATEVTTGEASRRWWLAGALVAFAFSFLTYPVAVPLVGVIIVLDYFPLRRFEPGVPVWCGARNRAVWVEKLPFLALAGAVGLATLAARWQAQGIWTPPPTLAEFGVGERLAQAAYVWAYYVWKPLWPTELAPVYTTLVEFDASSPRFVASALAVAGVTALLCWRRARWPGAWALWLAHLLLLAPMLGLTESPHYTNDRYGYLQGGLWAVLIAMGFGALGARRRRWALGVSLPAICALGLMSVRQIPLWRDSETLLRRLHEHVGPGPYRADIAMRLGEVLRINGLPAEARVFLEESLRIAPAGTRAAIPHFGLGTIAQADGRFPEALEHFTAAARLDPALTMAQVSAAEILLSWSRASEAIDVLRRAVGRQPDDAAAQELLGHALGRGGRWAEAIPCYEKVAALRPRHLGSACNLVAALAAAGRTDEALTLGREVVRRAQTSAQARLVLGEALRVAGQLDAAIAELRESVRLKADEVAAHVSLGVTLGMAARPAEAAQALREAVRLDPQSAPAQFNLGLALRDLRQPGEAARAFRRVLELEPNHPAASAELARLSAPP